MSVAAHAAVCYVMSMSIVNVQSVNAKSIREYIRVQYIDPARLRRETLVTLRAGDIHRELGLRNRVPNVCQVMESKLLEKEAGVKVSSKQGPPSGRGTTLTVTYAVESGGAGLALTNGGSSEIAEDHEHPGVRLFLALRGLGKDTYKAAGGGEAWLTAERAHFYGPGKKDLA